MKPPVVLGQGTSKRHVWLTGENPNRMRRCDWLAVGFCVVVILIYVVMR